MTDSKTRILLSSCLYVGALFGWMIIIAYWATTSIILPASTNLTENNINLLVGLFAGLTGAIAGSLLSGVIQFFLREKELSDEKWTKAFLIVQNINLIRADVYGIEDSIKSRLSNIDNKTNIPGWYSVGYIAMHMRELKFEIDNLTSMAQIKNYDNIRKLNIVIDNYNQLKYIVNMYNDLYKNLQLQNGNYYADNDGNIHEYGHPDKSEFLASYNKRLTMYFDEIIQSSNGIRIASERVSADICDGFQHYFQNRSIWFLRRTFLKSTFEEKLPD